MALPGEVPKQHEGLGRRWDLDIHEHSSTGHRQAFVSTALAARGGNGGLSWPALRRTRIPPAPWAAFHGLDLHQPSWRRARPRGRAGDEDLGCEAWAPALPRAGPPAVTPAPEEGCVKPAPPSSDLPCVGTRPRALAKGSHVGGLKTAACMTSFTGTPTPPAGTS